LSPADGWAATVNTVIASIAATASMRIDVFICPANAQFSLDDPTSQKKATVKVVHALDATSAGRTRQA
jgi:hypothetical protein